MKRGKRGNAEGTPPWCRASLSATKQTGKIPRCSTNPSDEGGNLEGLAHKSDGRGVVSGVKADKNCVEACVKNLDKVVPESWSGPRRRGEEQIARGKIS